MLLLLLVLLLLRVYAHSARACSGTRDWVRGCYCERLQQRRIVVVD
jgi:hypothetical protein